MDDESSAEDRAFLARLHAIKPSNVLSTNNDHALPPMHAESTDTPDDLLARFQRIHSKNTTSSDVNLQPEYHVAECRPASPTIEELLAELGPEEDYTFDDVEMKEAETLLAEAQVVLPTQCDKEISKSTQSDNGKVKKTTQSETPNDVQSEEEEPEAAMQRVLDEANEDERPSAPTSSIEHPRSPSPPRQEGVPDTFVSLQFPSTPEDHFDDLRLPSVPTNAPTRTKAKIKGKPPSATDVEIDSWCIICCADAAVQCFGCDKDFYCWGCWREGHTGESAGLEEKEHVWERLKKARPR